MSTNFAKTLVWKHEYDVNLWRHKEGTPNYYHMPLNESPPLKISAHVTGPGHRGIEEFGNHCIGIGNTQKVVLTKNKFRKIKFVQNVSGALQYVRGSSYSSLLFVIWLFECHPASQWRSQSKYWGVKNLGGEQNIWFWANNTILFGKTPLKAQNDYIF